MKCPRCNAANEDDARFCEECGVHLSLTCSSCGATVALGKKFCRACGAQLAEGAATRVERAGAPRAYVPQHLAERILSSRGALEGERKQVTVLFSDIKGSMELLAERDPEEARKLLDPVLEHMMEAVHRYEGMVNQVTGDGIMALFGAPLAQEDHAVRACYAALRMQESVKRHAHDLMRSHGLPVRIRVGVNSGEVVVRAIGSDLHMDYTAVGQTTHLAARMEQLADPGTVLIAPDTLRLVEGLVNVNPRGPAPVKGLSDPVELFELIGAGAARSRFQASAQRGLSKFVGRTSEVEQTFRALERAAEGHGQVVALVGEPGVGKSRLVWELVHSHRVQNWLVLESGSVSYGKATAYRPLIDLLHAYFRIEDRDDPRRIQEKVTGKLLTLDRSLDLILVPLLALLDVQIEDPEWQRLNPFQRRSRMREAGKRLLLRESQMQPVVLVFEDLHWIDSESQAVLDSLVESLPAARLLLLVNYRPEYQHQWGAKSYYTQLRVGPLSEESASAMLEPLLGNDASLEALGRVLIERTEGNPLFLEESVRTLVEQQVLVGTRGAYRLAKAASTIQVPATVQAIIAARIDRLTSEVKQLLQCAAVVGKDIPFPVLQAIGELPEDELRAGLGQLQAAEFLYEAALFPDLEYTFKHALTHEVAYSSVLQERRRQLHARIVEAIETLYPDRLAENAERMGHHAFQGEAWAKAVKYFRHAGEKAVWRSTYREGALSLERALEALAHLPQDRAAAEQSIDLRLPLGLCLLRLAQFPRLLRTLRDADQLLTKIDDPVRIGAMNEALGNALFNVGDVESAVVYAQRALEIGTTAGRPNLIARSNFLFGITHQTLGRYRDAIAFHTRNFSHDSGDLYDARPGDLSAEPYILPVRETYGLSCSNAAACHALLGEFVEAIGRGEQGVSVAEELDNPTLRVTTGFSVGLTDLLRGSVEEALATLEHTRQVCEAADLVQMSIYLAPILGYAYVMVDRLPEAVAAMERGLQAGESAAMFGWLPFLLAHLGHAYALAGRNREGVDAATRGLQLARHHKERGHEAWALYLLGNIEAEHGAANVTAAAVHYRSAIALAEELGMRPLEALSHFGLGLLVDKGERLALGDLETAVDMFRALGMTSWLTKAENAQRRQ